MLKELSTRKVRNEITNNKADKLTYNRLSDIYTFKTMTNYSAGYVAGIIRFALGQWEPELLEFYPNTKSWKPKEVIIRFYLRNKEEDLK